MNNDKSHEYYMARALEEAHKALAENEVPIGCVIKNSQGEIIASAYNEVEKKRVQLAHAECLAIQQACEAQNDWRLDGCWVYVTLEPCAMCLNLLLLSRVAGVVYGAHSPIFGYSLDSSACIQLYRRESLAIVSGVMKNEAAVLLKQFFKKRRGGDGSEEEA